MLTFEGSAQREQWPSEVGLHGRKIGAGEGLACLQLISMLKAVAGNRGQPAPSMEEERQGLWSQHGREIGLSREGLKACQGFRVTWLPFI